MGTIGLQCTSLLFARRPGVLTTTTQQRQDGIPLEKEVARPVGGIDTFQRALSLWMCFISSMLMMMMVVMC